MAKTRSMTRNQNHDDDHSSSIKKKSKTFDKGDGAAGSDLNLNHDVLLLVIMQLEIVGFLAFSGVCKSWRSLALSIKNTFMASKPPMKIWRNDGYCYLKDFKGRKFKSILPHSAGSNFSGLSCGYLILMGKETHDFWLVNPITRQELHFPDLHSLVGAREVSIRAILVFSPSISGWVFAVLHRRISRSTWGKANLSFYIDGKKGWSHVSSTIPIRDLHFFKGKIYTLHTDRAVRELRLYPNRKRKWTLIETTNFPKSDFSFSEFVSSGENLYAISHYTNPDEVMEVDIGELKLVSPEKRIGEYAFFLGQKKSSAAIKPRSWAGSQTQYKCTFYNAFMWYFPHDCLTVNILDE